jgi:hypothetical protein
MPIATDTKFYSTELILGHITKAADGHWTQTPIGDWGFILLPLLSPTANSSRRKSHLRMNRLQYLMIFDLSSLSVDVYVNAVYRPAYVCNSSELAVSSIDVSYQLGTMNSIYTYKCCCCCGDRRAPPNANQMEVSGTVKLNPHVESKGREWVAVIGKEEDDSWANRVELRKHERRQ